jgi:hypothetical protein
MRLSSPSWRPGPAEATRLFAVGSIVGPLVDSLHNQCLLEYHTSPIMIDNPFSTEASHLFASSWVVPPLLGIAYVVLGGVLPRLAQMGIDQVSAVLDVHGNQQESLERRDATIRIQTPDALQSENMEPVPLRKRAFIAVISTALLITLSSYLETSTTPHGKEILLSLALLQWLWLDNSLASLLVASLAAVSGPLSELPFVGHHVWTYLPLAMDYFPLQNIAVETTDNRVLTFLLGSDYRELGLASITGPCYFAVTMDAIACGRAFAEADRKDEVTVI